MNERQKQYFVRFVRAAGLLGMAEKIRAISVARRLTRTNGHFLARHPDVQFPPVDLMHDPYGTVDYGWYWESGREVADELRRVLDESGGAAAGMKILEWGCGPARIIRHLPSVWPEGKCALFGSDYNAASINWCRARIPKVTFTVNDLAPPLDYPDDFFDFIYCLSVFTHLSEAMHHAWFKELMRILKPSGRLLLTLNGSDCRRKLLPGELARYDAGELVVRDGFTEGRRMFAAFHGERFVRERFLGAAEILRHESSDNRIMPRQDVWLVRKPA